ncbi:UDP-N-acetylglucosamine diphosphorylase/glucosamine-1-phosphate N-acetyltransferase [Caldichromatium japonicum]|uniref:Bifunctional protein GlmU n=1 Tax=Caldichromatium japonicum TaxID=2699430 RepID=A0A6G7VFN7_9GAMM|nr:bifunctional UDP-N-acetylglucosamine diphosphorylase/glucosamine-1-phosphate N-acetyltransferase GlmU [Caldichromatium japonicum]QIK38859.1 UDP-N-acetylglucosamine diphosphorylase/glucosamine-1-phosphate N-acetyltransferase [Caldichromatium japonicum]
MNTGVVILAAGLGKRMRSCLPKVLHPLAGRPLLAHVLETARALNPLRLIIVYGHGGEQVRAAFPDPDCLWVEQAEQRGTGNAVMQALPVLHGLDQVVVLYGDVPLIQAETLKALLALAEETPLALLTAELVDPAGYGRVVRDQQGRVLRVVEERDADEAERQIREVNTGLLVAERRHLEGWLAQIGDDNAQGEYYLTDIIALAAQAGIPIATTQPQGIHEILGVNDRQQLAELERIYQRGQAEALMRSGVTLADPDRFDLRGRLIAAPDVFIDIDVIIEGEVHLASGVRIGPYCLLKNCTIGADSEVLSHSVIEGARVGSQVRIGPFARIRPETELADAVHIGNFVEVKKSRIAQGSKANHLSYLGDAEIGLGVNIGAGTITCNYDGVNKHPTCIEDGAFIGSNTALVAPVRIGAYATIGAGSVITRDVPPDRLTLARARQVTVEGWRRPLKRE